MKHESHWILLWNISGRLIRTKTWNLQLTAKTPVILFVCQRSTNISNKNQAFALKITHGFGFELDSWIFMDFLGWVQLDFWIFLELGWVSSSQLKPETVGIFGCKCLKIPINKYKHIQRPHFCLFEKQFKKKFDKYHIRKGVSWIICVFESTQRCFERTTLTFLGVDLDLNRILYYFQAWWSTVLSQRRPLHVRSYTIGRLVESIHATGNTKYSVDTQMDPGHGPKRLQKHSKYNIVHVQTHTAVQDLSE